MTNACPCGETEGVRRYVSGFACPEHTPARLAGRPEPPEPTPLPPSPKRPPVPYGTARTDPLGRDGPGWHISTQTRLPVRTKS